MRIATPGHRRHPPLVEDEAAARRDHRAPFRQRRLRAEAEKAETGGGQDDAGHVERHAHDQRGDAQRHDVAQHDAERRGAHQPDRGDVVGIAHRQRFGARDAGIGRPGGDGDGEHRILDAGAERGDEGQRQDQLGKGEKDVGDAHQDRIDPAAGIAGDGADQQADRRGDDRDQNDDVAASAASRG